MRVRKDEMSNHNNPSRFYSFALGKFRNFQARTDGLIAQADTTPDVALNSLLYANNSAGVTISYFDNGAEGQVIHVINLGSDLSFNGAQLRLTDSSNLAVNDCISFINSNSAWYELSRSHAGSLDTISIAHGTSSPDVKNAAVVFFNGSGAQTVIAFSNATVGQRVVFWNNGPSAITINTSAIVSNSAGNYVLTSSQAISAVFSGTRFFGITHPLTP